MNITCGKCGSTVTTEALILIRCRRCGSIGKACDAASEIWGGLTYRWVRDPSFLPNDGGPPLIDLGPIDDDEPLVIP